MGSPTLDSTYWERVARTRWGSYISEIEKRAILRAHALCRKPSTALEIGCEGGRWSKLLPDLGWNMVCTDVDENALRTCKKRIPTANCILVNPDERTLPCASESVRLLLCIEVGPIMEVDWFINEASRVLKNDGLIVGVFWNLLSVRGLFAHIKASLTGNFDYYQQPYVSWRNNLLNRGYHILCEEGFCWFPFSRASNSILIPYFASLEKKLGLHRLAVISPWIGFIAQKNTGSSRNRVGRF
jgi:hypothetical protein